MAGSLRRRSAALVAGVVAVSGLAVATAGPAAADESYGVSYPLPARYYVDSAPALTVGVDDFESGDPEEEVRTVEVRARDAGGLTVAESEVTLTPEAPTASVPFATQQRGDLVYSVVFRDHEGDWLDQEQFVVQVVGRATTLTTRWPQRATIRERARYVVAGQVDGGARTVLVQRRAADTWMTLGTTRSQVDGSYQVRVDTTWVTVHRRLRVLVLPSRTHEALTRTRTGPLTVTRSYLPRPGRAWKPIRGDRFPGQRWSPCGNPRGVLTYRVNPARAPRGHLTEIRTALAQVTAATGFAFRYAGKTSLVPLKPGTQRVTRNADFTIAYATERIVPALRGGVIGVAPVASQYADTDWWRVVAAGIVLDTQAQLAPGFAGGRATRGSVLIHELGHVMGLDHVSDRRQVMFPAITRAAARYATGDLRGLEMVGVARGCFPAEPNPFGRARPRGLPERPTRTVVHRVRLPH